MMKTFNVTTMIQATPEKIWGLLTNSTEYPAWNPTVEKVTGRIAAGEKVTVFSKMNPGRAFPVKVTEFQPATAMTWTGGMPLGLFKGERTFRLHKREGGQVQFEMREAFSGLLSPLFANSIPDLQPSFDAFAKALKAAAEIA